MFLHAVPLVSNPSTSKSSKNFCFKSFFQKLTWFLTIRLVSAIRTQRPKTKISKINKCHPIFLNRNLIVKVNYEIINSLHGNGSWSEYLGTTSICTFYQQVFGTSKTPAPPLIYSLMKSISYPTVTSSELRNYIISLFL